MRRVIIIEKGQNSIGIIGDTATEEDAKEFVEKYVEETLEAYAEECDGPTEDALRGMKEEGYGLDSDWYDVESYEQDVTGISAILTSDDLHSVLLGVGEPTQFLLFPYIFEK